MHKWCKDLGRFLKAALDRSTAKVTLFLFSVVGIWDTALAQLLPKKWADELPTVYDMAIMTGGLLPWYWWVIIGLLILLGFVAEFGLRQSRKISEGEPSAAFRDHVATVSDRNDGRIEKPPPNNICQPGATPPGPEEPAIDRQPINLAYEHLIRVGVFEEDGNDALQIANLLRQASLDGEISIWGSEPSSMPVEWQAPFLIEIERGYWRHHGIDPVRLMHDASELPDEGCKTERESPPWNAQFKCYWHLHVDMNQVGSIWRKQTRPDNE